ncbi:hypothetical protein ACWCO0_25675 [Streptomyces tubercidicus]
MQVEQCHDGMTPKDRDDGKAKVILNEDATSMRARGCQRFQTLMILDTRERSASSDADHLPYRMSWDAGEVSATDRHHHAASDECPWGVGMPFCSFDAQLRPFLPLGENLTSPSPTHR